MAFFSMNSFWYSPSPMSTFAHARSSAVSVPGLMGSQYFDLLAMIEKRGSTVMNVAPLAFAAETSCTCVLCMFSPRWVPMKAIAFEFARSSVSMAPGSAPYVRPKAAMRGPRH